MYDIILYAVMYVVTPHSQGAGGRAGHLSHAEGTRLPHYAVFANEIGTPDPN